MSKSLSVLSMDYQGMVVSFNEAGWFNATQAAERYGKRPNDWLSLPSTVEYLAALDRKYGKIPYYKTRRGGDTRKLGIAQGTWLHPKLGVSFARWLDIDFAVWCDEQIDTLLRGTHVHYDWKRMRHEAASTFKVMNAILEQTREERGKATQPHHYSNEARMVNWALTGEFGGVERDTLPAGDLDLLAKLEARNAVLIGRGKDYATRKAALSVYAEDWREARQPRLSLVR